MPIEIQTLQAIGAGLKQRATTQGKTVHDDYLIELWAYAHNPFLDVLNDEEHRVVLETIGNNAIKEQPALDAGAIRLTLHRVCHPKGTFDPCYNAARNILSKLERTDAVQRIDTRANELRSTLGIKKP